MGNLRPHFKLITKLCLFSIFTPVRLFPPLILRSLPQPSQQPLPAPCLPPPQPMHPLSAAREVLAQQKPNLRAPPSKHCMASQCLRIRTSLVSADPSVLSTHMQPIHSHMTHRAPTHFHFQVQLCSPVCPSRCCVCPWVAPQGRWQAPAVNSMTWETQIPPSGAQHRKGTYKYLKTHNPRQTSCSRAWWKPRQEGMVLGVGKS